MDTITGSTFATNYRFIAEFLASDGVGSACKALILPILFKLCDFYFQHKLSKALIAYGTLLACLKLGEITGIEVVPTNNRISREGLVLLLIVSLLVFAASSNTVVIIFAIFIMGLSSSSLRRWFDTYTNNWKNIVHKSVLNQSFTASQSSLFSSENRNRRYVLIFCFVSIFSCAFYDETSDLSYPAFSSLSSFAFICIILSTLSIVINMTTSNKSFLMKLLQKRNKNVKPKKSTKKRTEAKKPVDLEANKANPEEIPENFLVACNQDRNKALAMYKKSLAWRQENDMDNFLDTYQANFQDILRLYPHAIHGVSKDGCVVLYEVLGKAKPKELVKLGILTDDLVTHFNLRNEFVFQRSKTAEKTSFVRIMTVVDVKNISMGDVTSDVIGFIKQSSEVMDSYYPGRVVRLVICNAPSWFYSVWSMVARVLPESVRKKIAIIADCKGLDEFIEPNQRPEEYGGTDDKLLGQSEDHLNFLKLPLAWPAETKDEESEVKATPAVSPKASANDGEQLASNSFWGWISKPFSRKKPVQAYLGRKNNFKYDPVVGLWSLEDSNEEVVEIDEAAPNTTKTKESELEEHALLLAIQAAQMVSLNNATGAGNSGSVTNSATSSGSASVGTNLGQQSSGSSNGDLSPHVFIVVGTMYFLAAVVQSAFFTLLPVFLYLPAERGGSGYSPLDVGLLVSSVCMMLFVLEGTVKEKITGIIKESPLRAIRIFSGLLFVVCVSYPIMLSLLQSHEQRSFSAMQSMLSDASFIRETPSSAEKFVTTKVITPGSVANVTMAVESVANAASIASIHSQVYYMARIRAGTPSASFLNLPVPCLLMTVVVGASSITRIICGMLLQVALNSVFTTSSKVVIQFIHNIIDVSGPLISSIIYAVMLENHFSFPLNASSIFALSFCVYSLIYLLTLTLRIQFRGDFGVIPDNSGFHEMEGGNRANSTGESDNQTDPLKDLVDIPKSDLRYLFSQQKLGFGTRLHNLKVDLKEL